MQRTRSGRRPSLFLAACILSAASWVDLAKAQGCPDGYVECADGCMPDGSVCCGPEGYCDAGFSCAVDGCIGDSGAGAGGGGLCPVGYEECADACMPEGAVCCGPEGYCEAGFSCEPDGCALGDASPDVGAGDDEGVGCPSGTVACADACMPEDAVCCGQQGYCDSGQLCVDGGCMADPSGGCGTGLEPCAEGCMPEGSVCCGQQGFCDADEVCADGGCASAADSEPQSDVVQLGCAGDQVECGDGCMPEGAVCCGELGFCDAGQSCGDGKCVDPSAQTGTGVTSSGDGTSTDDGTRTEDSDAWACASSTESGCPIEYCFDPDTRAAYYQVDNARFDCESADATAGCQDDVAGFCEARANDGAASTSAGSSSDDGGCGVAPQRRGASNLFAALALLSLGLVRRSRRPARG